MGAGAFSRGVGGNAESRICHYFSPLPSPPGAKAKAKANATLGTARPGSCTLHLLPERPASAFAGSRAPQPARARKVAGEGAAEGKAMACLRLRGYRISDFSGLLLLLLLLWPPVTPGRETRAPLGGGRGPGRRRGTALSAPPPAAASRSGRKAVCARRGTGSWAGTHGTRGGSGGQGQSAGPASPPTPAYLVTQGRELRGQVFNTMSSDFRGKGKNPRVAMGDRSWSCTAISRLA